VLRQPCGMSLRESAAIGIGRGNLNPARLPIPPSSLAL
jgi:hypothetical protein